MKMKIMVCYDGSSPSIDALILAKKHAKAFQGKIFIVTSMKKGGDSELNKIDEMKEKLKSLKNEIMSEKIKCETHLLIRGLSVGEDLVNFSEDINADEIIIGVKRRSKVEKLVFGSAAQFVILKADCPVLAVK